MLYRVLCFVLLFAASAHAAALKPATDGVDAASDEISLAALLYGFRYTSSDVPHPMNAANGNLMWDASGLGCIDGGDWADPFPGTKGDLRQDVFCIPQPCIALLTPEELAREVYGRPVEDYEYETYLSRLAETCGEVPPAAAVDEAGVGLDEYMQLASFQLVSATVDDFDYPVEPFLPLGYATPRAETPGPGPVSLLADSGRTIYPAFLSGGSRRSPVRWPGPGGGPSFGRGGGGGGGNPGTEIVTEFTPKKPDRQPPGRTPGTRPPTTPGGPGGGDPQPSPSPVPLAGGLPLLLTAVATFAAGGSLPRQRRRSRRELIG